MSDLTRSYRKVRYDLRPAKQVERLMLIDALRRLTGGGFDIPAYQYTGMGSIHFYDFSLFHRYAGISNMMSVEASKAIKRRVKFNCPCALIDVKIAKIGSVIGILSDALNHLLWLDYDSTINTAHIADITQAISHLRPGSIVLATVDVEPPKEARTPKDVRDHFELEFGDLLPADQAISDFTAKRLPELNVALIWRAIQRGLSGRDGLGFQLLFNFVYRDGHRMITLGGMIVDNDTRARLRNSSIFQASYVRRSPRQRPYTIRVPVLTRKERLYLDGFMPCDDSWRPVEFELDRAEVKAYRDIYRFAPHFAELIL